MDKKPEIHSFSDGEIRFWIEDEASIHMKSATRPGGDPVELTSTEARDIARALLATADKLDALD